MRPASLKNRTQRKDVRQTIDQVTEKRSATLELDATEVNIKPTSKSKTKAPLESLKERVPKSTDKSASKNTKERQVEKPAPKPAPKKAKPTTAEMVRQYGYSGRLFRAIRETQGLSISDLSQRTNVPVNYINAIENEDFGVFSNAFFVRGVVKNISRSLGIQERAIVEGFLSRMGF